MCGLNEAEIRRDERERMAKMLEEMFRKGKPGAERFAYAMATTAIRRGRLLTDKEQLQNLRASIHNEPAPHPAPKTAV